MPRGGSLAAFVRVAGGRPPFGWVQYPAESCFPFLDEGIAANQSSRSEGIAGPFQLSMVSETRFYSKENLST